MKMDIFLQVPKQAIGASDLIDSIVVEIEGRHLKEKSITML